MHETGLENTYVFKNNKKLRCGYTTGSCAAAAAKAATLMLLSGYPVHTVALMTPKGILLDLEVLEAHMEEGQASCAIRKDAGDDPDATNGILVYAKVACIPEKDSYRWWRGRRTGDKKRSAAARGRSCDQSGAQADDTGRCQ